LASELYRFQNMGQFVDNDVVLGPTPDRERPFTPDPDRPPMNTPKRILLLAVSALCLASPASAGHELGVRAGGFDDFYLGAEWQTPARVGQAIFAPSVDFTFGDLDAVAINGDLRWDLLPVFDTGMSIYGKAGPTVILADQNNEIGLSLSVGADIGMRNGRSLQIEWRFGLGDIPDSKLGVALMFRL
jgi:hypothetical protein